MLFFLFYIFFFIIVNCTNSLNFSNFIYEILDKNSYQIRFKVKIKLINSIEKYPILYESCRNIDFSKYCKDSGYDEIYSNTTVCSYSSSGKYTIQYTLKHLASTI